MLYLQCTCGLPAYRYVIMQFPLPLGEAFNFCELDVYIRRKLFFFKTDNVQLLVNRQADSSNYSLSIEC